MAEWNRLQQESYRGDSGTNNTQSRARANPQLAPFFYGYGDNPDLSWLRAAQDIAWSDPEMQRKLQMYYLLMQSNLMPQGGFRQSIGY